LRSLGRVVAREVDEAEHTEHQLAPEEDQIATTDQVVAHVPGAELVDEAAQVLRLHVHVLAEGVVEARGRLDEGLGLDGDPTDLGLPIFHPVVRRDIDAARALEYRR
jgi:hypothetical protein